MATITSAGSGLWSAGATWVGGVAPADNDAVVIASGHVVEFDVDQSGFANGIDGITITGTLSLTRTTGTYYMKIKAYKTIGGAGTFDCGTSGSIIPFAAKHTITGGAAWYINGAAGLTMTVYAAEPTNLFAMSVGVTAIGATRISIDRDVSGDLWTVGDIVRISDSGTKQYTGETLTIAAIGADYIDITAGLSAVKQAGSYIVLCSRNLKVINGGGNNNIRNMASGKLTIGGGEFSGAYCMSVCYPVITGGVFCPTMYTATNGGFTINGGVFSCGGAGQNFSFMDYAVVNGGYFIGSGNFFSDCRGVDINGGFFACGGSWNNAIIQRGWGKITGGTFTNIGSILGSCVGEVSGGTYTNILYDIVSAQARLFDVNITGQNRFYEYFKVSQQSFSEWFNVDGVANAYKAWTSAGFTNSVSTPAPTGYSQSNKTTLITSALTNYWQKEVTVSPGASVNIVSYLRKSTSMAYLPKVIIFDKSTVDPFSGGAGLHTFTMTDSVDTWETETWTYTNSGTADKTLVIRTQGKSASGDMFSVIDVEQINVDLTTALAQIAAVKAKTDNLPADPADESALEAAIAAITVDNAAIAAAVMSSNVEGTITTAQALRLMLAVLAGKASGGGTTTVTFRDTADSKDRVTATVDSNGNRSAVTLDGA